MDGARLVSMPIIAETTLGSGTKAFGDSIA
jgi:hypothetical protein